jgi:hypothetical protein
MSWYVVGLEIASDDLFDVLLSDGRVQREVMGIVSINGSIATLSGCHIQGGGPNNGPFAAAAGRAMDNGVSGCRRTPN